MTLARAIRDGLRQPWSFEHPGGAGLRRFVIATALTLLILLWLQPFGGERYRPSLWFFRLAGYGVCLLLAVLPMRVWARRRYRQQGHWHLQDELQALALWALVAVLLSYFHNITWVSPRAAGVVDFFFFTVLYALPMLLVLFPVLLWRGRPEQWLHQAPGHHATRETGTTLQPVEGADADPAPPPEGPWLEVRGRNRDEQLRFRREQFVCAQAQQNYVRVLLVTDTGLRAHLLRLPISVLADALDDCWRVHRSWLVAPERVRGLSGARRQRQLHLDGVEAPVPVSTQFTFPSDPPPVLPP